MIRSVKSTVLSAVVLGLLAGSGYAAEVTYSSQTMGPKPSTGDRTQTSLLPVVPTGDGIYSAATAGPKPSTGEHTQTTLWQKPAGYDQDPAMHPYTRDGVLKAN
jgi:hypothetical protein